MFGIKPLGMNFTMVEFRDVRFWFSYETCICFVVDGKSYQPCNLPSGKISKTTRTHLNQCPFH